MKVLGRRDDGLTSESRAVVPLRPWTRRLAHVGLWGLISIAAIGGVAGLIRAPASAPRSGSVAEIAIVPAPVVGFAEVAVRAWLTANPDSVALLDTLFAVRPEPAVASAAAPDVGDVTTVAAHLVEPRYWAVTVAARVGEPASERPSTLWFFEVGVMEDGAGALAVAGTPALVPAARVVADPRQPVVSTLRRPDPRDPIATTVEGFLAALLTGGGDVTRYLAPDVTVAAVSPAPFRAVELSALASTRSPSNEVLVRAEARGITSQDGTWTLSYELVLAERGGRWEVRSVAGAPTLGPATAGAVTATTPTSLNVATTATSLAVEPGA